MQQAAAVVYIYIYQVRKQQYVQQFFLVEDMYVYFHDIRFFGDPLSIILVFSSNVLLFIFCVQH